MILEELNKKLRIKFSDYLGFYKFGSNKTLSPDSDIDVVLLFKEVTRQKKWEVYGILSSLEAKHSIVFDIKILTPVQFRYNPFFYEQVTLNGIFYE